MTEELKQIGDIIKTWNLNVDSATLAEMTKSLSPYIMWLMIKDALLSILGLATLFGCVFTASRVIVKLIKSATD